jgi:pilus assembly protein Flp/PilA
MGGVKMIWKFLKDDGGATAIEYGLIVGLISLAILAAVSEAGTALQNIWEDNASALQQAMN